MFIIIIIITCAVVEQKDLNFRCGRLTAAAAAQAVLAEDRGRNIH